MVAFITFETSVTLRNVEALRGQLLEAFTDHASVELDATTAAEIDLSVVQLLEAARLHADQEDKCLRLSKPAHPALAALLDRAGFLTAPTVDDIDFWFHGDLPQ